MSVPQPMHVAKAPSAKGPRTKKQRNQRRIRAERQARLERIGFWRYRPEK